MSEQAGDRALQLYVAEVERIIQVKTRFPGFKINFPWAEGYFRDHPNLSPEMVAMIYLCGQDHTSKPFFLR